ncbi:MAG: hypothetical protein JNJ60_06345, partial [Rhodocyclaceae bacterium]|nr:hypothetical protein [Rhodocyclaceae bacterium]
LTRVMRDAGLAKADLLALALAIVKLDSGDFRLREEAPNQFNTDPGAEAFNRYENRKDLGNVEAGDGARYKGRGYLQITGRAAYSRLGQALGLGEQLVQKPELALDPVIASRVLAQFIAERQAELSKNIAAGDFRAVSRTLFGGISQTARLTELIKAAQPLAQALLSAPTAR